MKAVFVLFVLKLVAGITLMWLLMPRKEVTDGFFRIQMLVVLGMCVLVLLSLDASVVTGDGKGLSVDELHRAKRITSAIWTMQFAAAFVAYSGHVLWKLGKRSSGQAAVFLLCGFCLGSLFLHSLQMSSQVPMWHQTLADASSAAVLGAALTSMLLGHWYLTAPTMSIRPLTWFAQALAGASLLRLIASGLSLARYGWQTHDSLHLWALIVRLIGGVAVPFITSIVVLRILRYRNTQSATGVLFAGLILVFMGELTAASLERELRIPY